MIHYSGSQLLMFYLMQECNKQVLLQFIREMALNENDKIGEQKNGKTYGALLAFVSYIL